MGESLQWLIRKAVETTPKLAYQVVASVIATLCAAFISNAHLASEAQKTAAAPTPTMAVIDAGTGASLLRANLAEDGYRLRPASVMEFASIYGLTSAKAYVPLAAAEWSTSPTAGEPADAKAAEEKPEKKTTMMAQTCTGECNRKQAASTTLLPPPRPTSLKSVVVAEAALGQNEAETPGDRPVQLLGLSLPGFVPSGRQVVSTVASLGDSVVGLFGVR